jgi:hypothetical protein
MGFEVGFQIPSAGFDRSMHSARGEFVVALTRLREQWLAM